MTTRAKAGIVKPDPKYALSTQQLIITEPTPAMKSEIETLEKNKTWTLVPKEKDMHVIGVK